MKYPIIILCGLLLTNLFASLAFCDAGKEKDSGETLKTAMRILLKDTKEAPKGKMAVFDGLLGTGDTVDTYAISPTIMKDRYVSILFFSKSQASLMVREKKTDKIIARTSGEGKPLEVITSGNIYLQIKNENSTEKNEYKIALWLAPKIKKSKEKEVSVGKNIKPPPADFTLFKKPE